MVEIDNNSPKDRLKESVTSPYDVEDSDLEALLEAIGNQFEDLEREREHVFNAKFVDEATGEQLEKLGEFVQISSRKGENESEFRQRIKSTTRSKLASGTYDEVEELISVLLDVNTSLVDIREFYNTDKPSFVVRLPVDAVGEKDINTRSIRPLINDVSAVGVNGQPTLVVDPVEIQIASGSVDIREMFEVPDGKLKLDPGNTTDAFLYSGLSSARLNNLSGDGYRGIEQSATELPVGTETIITEEVINVQIGPTVANIGILSDTTISQILSNTGLSSNKLSRLSAPGWEGNYINEVAADVGSTSVTVDNTISKTIGSVTGTATVTCETIFEQTISDAGLSANKLNRLSQEGWT